MKRVSRWSRSPSTSESHANAFRRYCEGAATPPESAGLPSVRLFERIIEGQHATTDSARIRGHLRVAARGVDRALAALDELPPRLDTPLLFPAARGGLLNLDNWRRRVWAPAIEAAGVRKPARIYDLRSTFASDALAAGVSVFELALIMGTSVEMIERHTGRCWAGQALG